MVLAEPAKTIRCFNPSTRTVNAVVRCGIPNGNAPWTVHRQRVRLNPGETKDVVITDEYDNPPFRFTSAAAAVFGSSAYSISCGVDTLIFPPLVLLEATPLIIRARSSGRIPNTPLFAELTLEAYSELDYLRWWIRVVDSDPSVNTVTHVLPAIDFVIQAEAIPVVRWERAAVNSVFNTHTIPFDLGGRWGDGQSMMLHGSLMCVISPEDEDSLRGEFQFPVTAQSTAWSGAWGPWGYVPTTNIPPGFTDPTNPATPMGAATNAYNALDKRRWAVGVPFANFSNANRSGSQPDFGSGQMIRDALGWPHRLFAIQGGVYQEFCRPSFGHMLETNGTPVTHITHPNVNVWEGVPHSSSGDNLGKASWSAEADMRTEPQENKPWWGPGWEWDSWQQVCYYTMSTGDPIMLEECNRKCEAWLGSYRIASTSATLNGIGAARAVGRSLQTGVLLYMVTGRADILQRILQRIQVVQTKWAGATSGIEVLWLGIEAHHANGNTCWLPWQESIGAVGLDAVAARTGDQTAARLATKVAKTVLDKGWVNHPQYGWVLPDAIEPNGTVHHASPPSTFNEWGLGCLKIARRTDNAALRNKAEAIIAQIEAPTPTWTRTNWGAVP